MIKKNRFNSRRYLTQKSIDQKNHKTEKFKKFVNVEWLSKNNPKKTTIFEKEKVTKFEHYRERWVEEIKERWKRQIKFVYENII